LPQELACIANQLQSFTALKWDLNCNLQVFGPLYQLSYEKERSRLGSNFAGLVEPWLVQSSLFCFLVLFHASVRPDLLCICGSETRPHNFALDGVAQLRKQGVVLPSIYLLHLPHLHQFILLLYLWKSVSNFLGKHGWDLLWIAVCGNCTQGHSCMHCSHS